MSHNESVIQWLIVVIIAMVAFLVGRSLFKKPQAPSYTSPALSAESIEDVLNKVLEKTANWDKSVESSPSSPDMPSSSGVSSKELEEAKAELNRLKSQLQAKEAELLAARESSSEASRAESASSEGESGDTRAYLEKISELEAKLAEYEILEDDIADLSLYKEENARLKAEMERLKGGGDPLEGSLSNVPEPENTDDLVKEFAEAVGKDKTDESGESDVPDIASLSAEEEPSSSQAQDSQDGVDDLFAELASEDLDTDKVVAELAEIEALSEAQPEDAFSEILDPEKVAQEAEELKNT